MALISEELVATALDELEEVGTPVPVALSNEIIHLLSDQLYQSPLKAIEELVVNSYDAGAGECKIYVPSPSDTNEFIIVFDNGSGMSYNGLINLWHVGRSNKREEEIELRAKRKQIGKFGIGKLATYTIANRLTYITRNEDILSVTVDFRQFSESVTGAGEKITLPVKRITDWSSFSSSSHLAEMLSFAGVEASNLFSDKYPSWTIAILEQPKDKAKKIKLGELKWVLRTAMPYESSFLLYVNNEKIISSKDNFDIVVSFKVSELPENRIKSLNTKTTSNWRVENGELLSNLFPSGISGNIIITDKTLIGKSDDIARSRGFFIRVRNRLVNDNDELFGLNALVHGTFNRFRATLNADDLDIELKASREALEDSKMKQEFRALLIELFNEANSRYEKYQKDSQKSNSKKEGERNLVSSNLVEHAVADALISSTFTTDDNQVAKKLDWFYLELDEQTDIKQLAESLYENRNKYKFKYTQRGQASGVVRFSPETSTFWINSDHELVKEYSEDARRLLEDFVASEMLLEVYLREADVPSYIVRSVLNRRDNLL